MVRSLSLLFFFFFAVGRLATFARRLVGPSHLRLSSISHLLCVPADVAVHLIRVAASR